MIDNNNQMRRNSNGIDQHHLDSLNYHSADSSR